MDFGPVWSKVGLNPEKHMFQKRTLRQKAHDQKVALEAVLGVNNFTMQKHRKRSMLEVHRNTCVKNEGRPFDVQKIQKICNVPCSRSRFFKNACLNQHE